jgi:hypothetical protein
VFCGPFQIEEEASLEGNNLEEQMKKAGRGDQMLFF